MPSALPFKRSTLVKILLVFIILTAGALRFYNLQWDSGTFPHPDERSTLLFYAPTIRWPDNPDHLLDPRQSTLNPFWEVNRQERRSYTYGHFPLYLLVATGSLFDQAAPLVAQVSDDETLITFFEQADTGAGYAVLGRGWVALLDTISVWLVFLIARRLYGDWAGLLAAALSAMAVLHIQLAHFFAVDPISTTFTLLTVYASMRLYEERSLGMAILAGLGVGLATASKFSALPVAIVPAVAALLMVIRPPENPDSADSELSNLEDLTTLDAEQTPEPQTAPINWAVYLLTVAAVVSFVSFAVTSPFVLLDFENFRTAVLEEQGNMVRGLVDFPFTRQYRNTLPYVYFIEQQIRWGLGWPLGLLAFAGLGWAMLRAVRGKLQPGEWMSLAWLGVYFGLTGLFLAKFMRYMSPVTPFVIIFGVGLLMALARRVPKAVTISLTAIVLGGTTLWAAMFVNGVYATEHSWVQASRWMYENIPAGSCIAREHWEEGVPLGLQEPGLSPGAMGYYQPQLPMYEADTQAKFESLRDILSACDYFVLASNRMSRTLPNLSERYPLSTRYYEALFAGDLGYEIVAEFETPPRLGPLVIDDQAADESFTVYDHPKAYVFEKTRQLSPEEWFAVLGNTWQGANHGFLGRPTLWMLLEQGDDPNRFGQTEGDTDEEAGSTWLEPPLSERPIASDWRWNTLATQNPWLGTALWWFALQAIALLTLPLTLWLFRRLPDRGYLLSKTLGLLLVSYLIWLPASFGLPANTLLGIGVALLLVALLNGSLFWLQRGQWREWLTKRWPLLLLGEAVFTLVFLFFIGLRLVNPDLWQPWNGGEKMMEIGFLTAVVKSASMPPYDPFFAGAAMNYYYYGMMLVSVLIKLTGIAPATAFNLAVPMFAALTAANVFTLAVALRYRHEQRRRPDSSPRRTLAVAVESGGLAVFVTLFFSNLDGLGQLLRNFAAVSSTEFESAIPGLTTLVRAGSGFLQAMGGTAVREYNFWDTSRVIEFTINEFPYWTFLFADLHPHLMVMPVWGLFLALTYVWFQRACEPFAAETESGTTWLALLKREGRDLRARGSLYVILLELAMAFTLGAIMVINTWDAPTYIGLALAAFVMARYRVTLHPLTAKRALILIAETLFFIIVLVGVSILLYLPFFLSRYNPDYLGVALVRDRIPLESWFKVWGFFIFVAATWLLVELRRPRTRFAPLRAISLFLRRWNHLPTLGPRYQTWVKKSAAGYSLTLLGVGAGLGLAGFFWLLDWRSIAVTLPLVLGLFLLLLRWEGTAERNFVNLLLFTGFLVLLGVQIVFIEDFLGGGDWYLMNTFFKFFAQVWVLFGVAMGVVLPLLWLRIAGWSRWGRWLWQAILFCLIIASVVFLIFGTRSRLDNRFPGPVPEGLTLDGTAYMTVGQFTWENVTYQLEYDRQAMTWLLENVDGAPVIAEAKVGYYREWGMRVAAYTGLPSVLGGLHQNEQHPPAQLGQRDMLVRQFWSAGDPVQLEQLLAELQIEYVYWGQLEEAIYSPAVKNALDSLVQTGVLRVAYSNPETIIYQVR